MPTWTLFTYLAAANRQLAAVKTTADDAAASVDHVMAKAETATGAAVKALTEYEKLAQTAQPFGTTYGSAGFDPKGGAPLLDKAGNPVVDQATGEARTQGIQTGGFISAAYLKYLVDLYAEQLKKTSDANNPMVYAEAQRVMAIMDQWWMKLGGFNISGFKTIDQLARQALGQGGPPVIDIPARVAAPPSTSGIGIGGGSLYQPRGAVSPGDGLPSDEDVMRAQDALYKLDDAGAAIQKKIDGINRSLDDEQRAADAIKDSIDATKAAIDASEQTLEDMAAAAGVSDSSGAGAKVKGLSDTLKEAQSRLQYLTDKGADAKTMADAQRSIDDLKLKLDEAQKQLRIATYEFEHSEAYALQQKEIADQKAALKVKEEEQEAEDVRLKAVQARIDAEQKRLDDIDVRRRQQQAIIDARRLADDARQAAEARKELEDSLKTLHGESSKFLGSFAASTKQAVAQINDAVMALAKVLPNAQQSNQGSVPKYTGHTPKPPSIDVGLSTLSL